jgi:hypothetical protein
VRRWETPDFCCQEKVNAFPAGENRTRRWPTIEKARRFWFNTCDCRGHSSTSFSFIQNIMQTFQGPIVVSLSNISLISIFFSEKPRLLRKKPMIILNWIPTFSFRIRRLNEFQCANSVIKVHNTKNVR